MKKLSVVLVFFITALLLIFTAAPIAAQGSGTTAAPGVKPGVTPARPESPEYIILPPPIIHIRTNHNPVKSVSAFVCTPIYSASTYSVTSPSGSPSQRYCTGGGGCYFECPVDLPSGALITGLEVQGCDTSDTGNILARLFKSPWNNASSVIAVVDSGTTATDGCSWWYSDPTTTETVDNYNSYFVEVLLDNNDTTTTFNGVLVYYQLQIATAPGTASFNDVPTDHPFFQYIEALYASGITTGCPYPNFCPDMNVTRGQMAAFLARGLGLYWQH